jgi:hypothetical protein
MLTIFARLTKNKKSPVSLSFFSVSPVSEANTFKDKSKQSMLHLSFRVNPVNPVNALKTKNKDNLLSHFLSSVALQTLGHSRKLAPSVSPNYLANNARLAAVG